MLLKTPRGVNQMYSTLVAKSVSRRTCGFISHANCLTKTEHKFSNNQFVDCDTSTSSPSRDITISQDTLHQSMGDLISEEFVKFREAYNAYLERVNLTISQVSNGVAVIEGKLTAMPLTNDENITAEIQEREKSLNIALYNLDKASMLLLQLTEIQ